MKSYIALGCVLLSFACRSDEDTNDPIESFPTVEERLSSPITLRYLGEDGPMISATAFVFTSSRPLALQISMRNAGDGALSPETLARFRVEKQIEVTVEDGLDAWAVRGQMSDIDKLDRAAFYTYFETADAFPTICGDQIAKARLVLSDGAHTFKSRITVMDPFRPFGLYNSSHCVEHVWGDKCERVSADIPCSTVIDCGTALGGTRRCTGECKFTKGAWYEDDTCHCEINEATCCAQTLPPRPTKTEAQTEFKD